MDQPFVPIPVHVLQALMAGSYSGGVIRVMLAVCHETYWKNQEKVSQQRIAELLGRSDTRNIRRLEKQAVELGILIREGHSVRLNEDVEKWSKEGHRRPGFKRGLVPARFQEKRASVGPVSKRASVGPPKEGHRRPSPTSRQTAETSTSLTSSSVNDTDSSSPSRDGGLFRADELEEPIPPPAKQKTQQQLWAERIWAAYGQNETPPKDVFAAVGQWILLDADDPSLEEFVCWLEDKRPRLGEKAKPERAIPLKVRKHRAAAHIWQRKASKHAGPAALTNPNEKTTEEEWKFSE